MTKEGDCDITSKVYNLFKKFGFKTQSTTKISKAFILAFEILKIEIVRLNKYS